MVRMGIRFVCVMLTLSVLSTPIAQAAVSEQGRIEVLQTQATLEFHSNQHKECLSTLSKVLGIDPKNTNALELKALTFRKLKDDESAAKAYEELIQVGLAEKNPAYHFELGTIRYAQKKQREAAKHFAHAAHGKFNPGTSHFFLGLMFFNNKLFKQARHHLTSALTYSDAKSMAPVTRFYLANTYTQLGKSDAAIINFHEAEAEADGQSSSGNAPQMNTLISDIRKNALKELKNFDRSSKYINLSLLSQFDTNVQTNPSEVDNPVPPSDQQSMKGIFSTTFSYTTSPLKSLQFIPSYKFFTNYNFNEKTRDFNFASNTLTLYSMYKPYKRIAFGLKTEGTHSMKNNPPSTEPVGSIQYMQYSLVGDIGPIAKIELTPRVNMMTELTFRPKKFHLDPATGSSRRSGHGYFGRVSLDFLSPFSWWNPLIYFSGEIDLPDGNLYAYRSVGGGITNSLQLTDKFSLTGSIDLLRSTYFKVVSPPQRSDFNLSLRTLANYAVTSHWSAMADLGYIQNDSTVPASFKYNRFTTALGASYTF